MAKVVSNRICDLGPRIPEGAVVAGRKAYQDRTYGDVVRKRLARRRKRKALRSARIDDSDVRAVINEAVALAKSVNN